MDTTKGSWKYWACGESCEGGANMTNGGCGCACVETPFSCLGGGSQADKDALAELQKQNELITAASDSKRAFEEERER